MAMTPLKLILAAGLVALASMSWLKQREVARNKAAVLSGSGIVMLSASWCGYCTRLRAGLTAAHVPFTELDIEDSEQGAATYEAVNARGVPVTIIGEDVVHGYDAARLSRLVSARGHPLSLD